MEVHHHPHTSDPDSHRGRKKWTHYFWEFLMLFLAVFCGFLAENEREHLMEHRREKQYMHSLVRDLELDTTYLNLSNRLNITKARCTDSILKNFKENPGCSELSPELLRTLFHVTTFRFFVHHSGTINQLENSGGMRLIRKKEIVDSIEAYYQQVTRMQLQNSLWLQYIEILEITSGKVISSMDRLKRMSLNNNSDVDWGLKEVTSMTDRTPVRINSEYLNEFLNLLINMRYYTITTEITTNRAVFNKSLSLISQIRNEYQLE